MEANPFYELNAAHEPRIPEMRVDREHELDQCVKALIDRRQNVLVYGERGVGKTFLVRLVEAAVNQKAHNVFPVSVSLAGLASYGAQDELASFSRAVLLQLCSKIWTNLLGKSYMDLRERLDETGAELAFRNKKEKALQRVYTQLMTTHRVAEEQQSNMIGFSAGAKGEKSETFKLLRQQSDVLPFEFAEFAKELIETVLYPTGKSRVVVICDEANYMPFFKQEELLRRYLDLFTAKNFQFVLVAGLFPWETNPNLPYSFESRIELKGFPEEKHVHQLISKAGTTTICFADAAIHLVFDFFKGHPRDTLQACRIAYDLAQERRLDQIDAALMKQACEEFNRQKAEWSSGGRP